MTGTSLLAICAVFGLVYGAIIQRSGFCFARAGLELFLLKSRDALNGVLAGMIVATIGFFLVSQFRPLGPSHYLLLPFGPGTVIGGVLFGLGMSLAGMCVMGSLVRLGEGYLQGAIALSGMVAGAAINPLSAFLPGSLLTPFDSATLSHWLGRPGATAATVLALVVIWLLAARRTRGKSRGPRDLPPAVLGGILLGLIATAQMVTYQPWTVAYPLGLVSAAVGGSLTGTSLRHAAPLLAVDVGMVLGALLTAARARSLRFRWPRQTRQVVLSLAGGVMMAWGVQLAHGCSIGGAFSAVPSLSLSAWLFVPALALGWWLGAGVLRRVG